MSKNTAEAEIRIPRAYLRVDNGSRNKSKDWPNISAYYMHTISRIFQLLYFSEILPKLLIETIQPEAHPSDLLISLLQHSR